MVMNRIRALRKEAGYNQKELGNVLGVGQTTVSAWEIGRNEPDNEMSHKMAKLFGCSIGYLMGYEAESKYRGLSETEWNEFCFQKHIGQREMEQEENDENKELERIAEEDYKTSLIEEWEKTGRTVFEETIEIDAIMEDLTASQRKALLDMVKSAKSAFG